VRSYGFTVYLVPTAEGPAEYRSSRTLTHIRVVATATGLWGFVVDLAHLTWLAAEAWALSNDGVD
jgi:hypothetical protein